MELAVVAAETVGYRVVTRVSGPRALAVSLVCNLASGALSWLPR